MRVPRFFLPALCILLLGAAGGAWVLHRRAAPPPGPELATPMLALAHLEHLGNLKSLFYTPAATEFLQAHRREWGIGDADPEALTRQFNAAAQDPKAWRALDRERRFDAVLLTGDPAGFRPLLDHLRKSPDWTLTLLDPTSFVFERAPVGTAWTAAEIEPLKALFKTHSTAEQVTMRVQVAHRLTAIGETGPAQALLAGALQLDPGSSPAWTETACNHAALGQWSLALETARRAVKADAHYLPALAAEANALLATGKFDEALAITRRLVVETPDDGENLVLHAKVTHAAHAYGEEIETLNKIISKAEDVSVAGSGNRLAGSWRIYLAQAYAADGQGEKSLDQFKTALKDPALTEQERAFAEKGIARLQSRTPIF